MIGQEPNFGLQNWAHFNWAEKLNATSSFQIYVNHVVWADCRVNCCGALRSVAIILLRHVLEGDGKHMGVFVFDRNLYLVNWLHIEGVPLETGRVLFRVENLSPISRFWTYFHTNHRICHLVTMLASVHGSDSAFHLFKTRGFLDLQHFTDRNNVTICFSSSHYWLWSHFVDQILDKLAPLHLFVPIYVNLCE